MEASHPLRRCGGLLCSLGRGSEWVSGVAWEQVGEGNAKVHPLSQTVGSSSPPASPSGKALGAMLHPLS